MDKYVPTIGIECHVQLKTKSKLFSSADNDAREAAPNGRVAEIDYALPGMLPYLNKEAVRLACRAAKALGAEVAKFSMFDRKHYFYPDLPKGYQISQMYHPIIIGGGVELPDGTRVRIEHAHLEEDAGKLVHGDGYTVVDLNRAGTPLIEIVSMPDMHTAAEARAYAEALQQMMVYADVSYGDLYYGNMRFDVNVSVSDRQDKLGTRTEIKNLNSFHAVEAATEYEIDRQTKVLESGGEVKQETRGWLDDEQKTVPQRGKEDAQDYRYMPDADIPPIMLSDEQVMEFQKDFLKMPGDYRAEFASLGVDGSVVKALLIDRAMADLVSEVMAETDTSKAKRVANLLATKLGVASVGEKTVVPSVADLIALAEMLVDGEINSSAGDRVFELLVRGEIDTRAIAERENLIQMSDASEVEEMVDRVMESPAAAKAVEDVRSGEQKAVGFLVGMVMKESRGKANPELARKIILAKLG